MLPKESPSTTPVAHQSSMDRIPEAPIPNPPSNPPRDDDNKHNLRDEQSKEDIDEDFHRTMA